MVFFCQIQFFLDPKYEYNIVKLLELQKKAICTIARNVAIFGLNNSSSSYTDNWKKNFLVLGKGDAFGFNGTFSEREIEFNVIFSNARSNF